MNLDDFLKDHVAKSELQTTFFHFTDIRNLDLIKKHGLLSRRKLNELGIQIPAPGGNKWSMESADRLGLDRCASYPSPLEQQATVCLANRHEQGGQLDRHAPIAATLSSWLTCCWRAAA
jgi:hypothetical protein